MAELTSAQLDTLAWTMLGEAAGEGPEGQAAVAQVIRNRSLSGQFSRNPAKVAKQPSQFSTWNSGEGGNDPKSRYSKSSPAFKQARQIASKVFAGEVPDVTGGALYYHTTSIKPSWAKGVKTEFGTTDIGNHRFYPRQPVPPENIPQVATALDAIERVAPVASPNLPSMRSAYAASLPELPRARPVTPSPRSTGRVGDLVQSVPSSIIPSLDAGRFTGQKLDVAYARNDDPNYINSGAKPYPKPAVSASDMPRARPATPMPAPTVAPPAQRSPLDYVRTSASVLPADNPTLQSLLNSRADKKAGRASLPAAYNPVTPAQRAALSAAPSVARAPVQTALAPAMPSLPRADPRTEMEKTWAGTSFSKAEDERARQVANAPQPLPRSAVDAARERLTAATPPKVARVTSEGLNVNPVTTVRIDPATGMPTQTPMPKIASFAPAAPTPPAGRGYNEMTPAQRNALSALPGPFVAQPNYAPKSQTRLRTAEEAPPTNNSVAPLYNPAHPLVRDIAPTALPLDMPPAVASVPLPRARPSAPAIPASLTQVAMAPTPMPALNRTPMGGPTNLGPVKNFLGMPNAVPKDFAVAPNAPLPTPRIERGGIFGKPQIFGMDIPLPGVFGVIQNATKAMNNASGPFNNGLDNSIYMGLRGGNFTAPGAATHIGTNGFIYAQKPGGGFVNVGRAPTPAPSTFSAGRGNALDRMNAGRDDSGASASSIYG